MRSLLFCICFAVLSLAAVARGQQGSTGAQQTAAAGRPSPLNTPSITGPLQGAPPNVFDAGPLGKLYLNGVVSGFGLTQSQSVSGDSTGHVALSDGQIFLQKPEGWWQFYVQAGGYNILSLGQPFTATGKQLANLYGPVPIAYLKLAPEKNSSIQIGALPTLIGAEYTFDFQNMEIERGLLWNQENAITRGIQINQNVGKFAASFSWNDGYYSNRYSWLSGSLTYVQGAHSLSFVGMGNLSHTAFQTAATPVQNNSSMYALEYSYAQGKWIIQPYYQHSELPKDPAIGISRGASIQSGALLVSRAVAHEFSLTVRGEYIASSGGTNLLYGPGSTAWSLTGTPTYQKHRFFVRGELSIVRTTSITPGDAFGSHGTDGSQARGVLEIGLLF